MLRYIDEFRRSDLVAPLLERIRRVAKRAGPVTLMEVCGTHTTAIRRGGLRQLLPPSVRLISGPGCPVCVSPQAYIDRAVALARRRDVIITSFGDMLRVPGSTTSLEKERARGGDVRMVYSPLDALDMARSCGDKMVVFLAVGFETTSPLIASTLVAAQREGVTSFKVLPAHRLVPPALEALGSAPDLRLSGLICPGHVSVIIGLDPYRPLAASGVPCVVAGFEALDVLRAVEMLLIQVAEGRATVENEYSRVVRPEGNPRARELMDRAFRVTSAEWRGLGVIPASGLELAPEFAAHDGTSIEVVVEPSRESPGCCCGEVLRGVREPEGCPLFGHLCTPQSPQGACMVSSEGSCAAAWRYREVRP